MLSSPLLRRFAIVIVFLFLLLPLPAGVQAGALYGRGAAAANLSALPADDLITALNALRAEHGLSALAAHPILMQVAQTHAQYMASTGMMTHYSADGKRPFQRALDAGFPVAGDLTLGGFYSENITGGSNLTPQGAVDSWYNMDELHRSTMLSSYRSHVGVGVAVAGDMIYYVIDTALMSSVPVDQTVVETELPVEGVLLAPIQMSTAAPDGSVTHTVRSGETLWSIAAVYGLTVDQLVLMNQLASDQFIHPEDRLIIQPASTPTTSPTTTFSASPTQPPTAQATAILQQPSADIILLQTDAAPWQPNDEGVQNRAVMIVITFAIIAVFVILWHGFRRGKER